MARAGRPGEGRPVPRRAVLGPAGARIRRSRGADPHRGAGAGRPRRQPNGSSLHRRCIRRLPVRRDARGRPGQSADGPAGRRRTGASRLPTSRPRSGARRRRTSHCPRNATTARRTSIASSRCSRMSGSSCRSGRMDGRRRCVRSRRVSGVDPRPRPKFGHGAEVRLGPYAVIGSYHPSQQNVFTRRLTAPMLKAVLERARELTYERAFTR